MLNDDVAEEGTGASTTESTYSPALAKMLGVTPEALSGYSLKDLGRKAIGADTEAYKKKAQEVEAAQNALLASLESRKKGIDPGALALAAGFFAPTRTGSFGENLGIAMGNLKQAVAAENTNSAAAAKMRLELAKAGMADDRAMAQLGLNALKSLTPKLTKSQQQVMAEGLDPNSVEGRQRLMMLQFLESATPDAKEYFFQTGRLPEGVQTPTAPKPTATTEPVNPEMVGAAAMRPTQVATPTAPTGGFAAQQRQRQLIAQATPEMKMFSAISGVSLDDPTFAAGFKAYMETKDRTGAATQDMKDFAARTGLRLDDPTFAAK